MAIDTRYLKKKAELEQQLSGELVESEMGNIHNVYFDITMLQDIYVGALLLHAKDDPELYEQVIGNIPLYQLRTDKQICKYFPFLNITDEQLLAFIADPANADLLYKASPHTTTWFWLGELFQTIMDKNKIVDGYNTLNCSVYVNTYPSGYTIKECGHIKRVLKRLHSNIELFAINKPFQEISAHIRTLPDMYFMEDLFWLDEKYTDITKEMFMDMAYDKKTFFVKKRITSDNVTTSLDEAFNKSKQLLRVFTNFNYLQVDIPGASAPPITVDTAEVDLTIE